MISVIGLLREEVDPSHAIGELMEAGILEKDICLMNHENSIRELLGCDPACVVPRYVAWGAFIGVAINAIYGLVAAHCQCGLLGFGGGYGMGAFLGALLAGVFVGGFLGAMAGFAEFEKDSHLYVQGARMGGKVIVVQTQEEDTDRAKHILEQENAAGVRAI